MLIAGYLLKGSCTEKVRSDINNGNIYIGFLKGTKRDGVGEMVYHEPEGNKLYDIGRYKGNWKRDLRSGQGKVFLFKLYRNYEIH